jgi:DNA-binding IclR family transcriptional regulator
MAGNSTEPGRSVTSKVAAILLSFTNGRGHALVDLARQAGLPTSTAHRLARELTDRHLLERTDDGEFRVGLPLRMLCGEVAERPTLRERAPFVVDDLCEATRATTRLGVLDDLEVAYIERLPGHRPVSTFSAAARLPVHATALGRALLAFSPPQVVRMVLPPSLPSYTPATPTTPDQLHRALQCVRLHGMATSRGELHPRGCAVAVPVLGPCGTAMAAVEVDVPDLEGPTLGRVLPALVLAARGLARELAADPRPHVVTAAGVGGRAAG